MIQIKGISIKNLLSEYTLKEFQDISDIMNNAELEYIEKYIDILTYLGITDDVLDELTDDDLFDAIKELTRENDLDLALTKELEINGKTYVAYEDSFKLKAKDLALIEKWAKVGGSSYITKSIAVIFKEKGVSDHYNPQYLESKFKQFENVKMNLVYGYIGHIIEKIVKKIEILYGAK